MPLRKITPRVIFNNIVRDFEAAWNGIAACDKQDIGRGNFLFGLLATILLEWACRICREDHSGGAIHRLAEALYTIEPRYFTPLPASCDLRSPREFTLPSIAGMRPPPLIWVIFDLIRNGQAHQYQQIPARLDRDSYLWISVKAAEQGQVLVEATQRRASDHLAFCAYRDGNVGIRVRAHTLFFDVRAAIENSGLLGSSLEHQYLTRSYGIKRSELIAGLQAGDHHTFQE